jgi:hypothetical protein
LSYHDTITFPATLGPREKLITYAVAYGVGIGLPTVLGISFACGFSQPWLLLFPVLFAIGFTGPYFLRPTGFAVSSEGISVLRPIGAKLVPLGELRELRTRADIPSGLTIGLARIQGIYGTFGSFWNKKWGRFQMYVTNSANMVEIILMDNTRLILSPDDKFEFVSTVGGVAAANSQAIAIVEVE